MASRRNIKRLNRKTRAATSFDAGIQHCFSLRALSSNITAMLL